MIRVLGTKRVVVILVLVLLNAALAGMVYAYFVPGKAEKKNELRNVRLEISDLEGDIQRLQVQFDQLEEQQTQFDRLKKQGLLGDQGRRQAEKILEAIQEKANVVSAVVSIRPGVVEDNEEAQKAEYKVLKSPITVKIEALDDVDVFRYIYLVKQNFPGHVAVTFINLERKSEVTGTILRSIAAGDNPPLVEAEINMTWRTMIPESQVITQEGSDL